MQHVDLIIHARWIVPVNQPNTVLDHHACVIHGGQIAAILPSTEIDQQFSAERTLQRPDHVLIPGLINAHTHTPMSLMRGIADDMPLMQWLNNHIWPAEAQHVGPEFIRAGSQLAIAEMIRGGTTCFNDMYFFPDITAQTASDAGIRASVGMILIDFPSAWASSVDEYFRKGMEVRDQFRNDPLISTVFAPHAPYSVSDEPLKRLRMLADEMDCPVHMHVHETAAEVSDSVEQHSLRPLARLDGLGLLSPNLLAVHMTQLTDSEIARCAATGVQVLHCPESNMKLASGACPAQKLLDAGINVALGTDGAASNNDLDMIGEMRSAALFGKTVANDAAALAAETVLQMATLNGAKALGLADQIGSIEAGKDADLCCVDLADIANQPVYHPISQLVYSATRNDVSDVWVRGQQLLAEKTLTTLDSAAIVAEAQAWRDRITA